MANSEPGVQAYPVTIPFLLEIVKSEKMSVVILRQPQTGQCVTLSDSVDGLCDYLKDLM